MITIALADDHSVVRQGLRALLESEPNFKIVGEAADGTTAAQLTEKLQPDVLVLDVMMNGMNGFEVTRQVVKRAPRTAVVILSMYGNEGYIVEALRAGAKAYILKESTAAELVRAINEVTRGRRYLGSPLSEQAIEAYLQRTGGNIADPYGTLTSREREVFRLVAQGNTSAEIAAKLFISRRTVEIHRNSVMHKLNLKTQAQLVRYAMRKGVLPPDS
ncbi:MAG: response regulator transcription factor [Dehalococcoidales bacterium]|nr:response regulator transcription factor [Dehalococcoidales bacterium]